MPVAPTVRPTVPTTAGDSARDSFDAPAGDSAEGPATTSTGRRFPPGLMAALLIGGLILGLGFAARAQIAAPFGASHDGRNGGIWGSGSRSLRTDGPVQSRLGTQIRVGDETTVYANHPPFIYVETALAEGALGENPWSTRLPAWGATLAAILLAYRVLRWLDISPVASASGVLVGFGGPMIVTYGAMLDTAMIGLPFGLAVLLALARSRAGRPFPAWTVALMAVLACLTSWLGVILCGLAGLAEVRFHLRRRRSNAGPDAGSSVSSAFPIVVGTAIGVVTLFGWLFWAYGSLDPLLDQFTNRTQTSDNGFDPALLVVSQQTYLPTVFSIFQLLVAIPALLVCVRDPKVRAVGALATATWALWFIGFSDGAIHHDYWSYWLVVPLAVGVARMADGTIRSLSARRDGMFATAVVALVAVGVAAVGVLPRYEPARTGAAGVSAGHVAGRLGDSGQPTAWYLGSPIAPTNWIAYNARRPSEELVDQAAVDRLSTESPEHLVLVFADRLYAGTLTAPSGPCRAGVPADQSVGIVSADELSSILRAGGRTCSQRTDLGA